jgi:uncharacterized protein YndB with AHSA1/START domain
MTDLLNELKAVERAVGSRPVSPDDAREARTIVLSRRYDAPIDDVWDAVTDPERISRWFLPVTGDLKLGGRYQTEGNAGGVIKVCEPPRRLGVTWEMGETKESDFSEVELRLSEVDGGTEFTLEHVAVVDPNFWNQFGPGAVGVGWDLALLGLGAYLRGESFGNPEEFEKSPESRAFTTASCEAWEGAAVAGGIPADEARSMTVNTTAFYVPPLEDGAAP